MLGKDNLHDIIRLAQFKTPVSLYGGKIDINCVWNQ